MADRVLVVDDEQSLRKVLAATLQREGYEVTVCGDGEEAISALERDGADVVVTDLVMPRMDGLTLLRKVVARHPDVPVIVVTAHGRIDSAVEAMKAGAFEFLAKPFDHGELKSIIAKAARQSDCTGAVQSRPGRFELADGGTLFLDEIGEIPVEMQVKLLRAIQESEFERVGGVKITRVEVRLVAATSRDLTREIGAGRFREDLYYRLNVVPIHLPPLRERREDIPLLVEHFRQKYNARLRKNVERIEDEALACLAA